MVWIDQDTLCVVMEFLVRKELCALQLTSSRFHRLITARFNQRPSLHVRNLVAFFRVRTAEDKWETRLRIKFYKLPNAISNNNDDNDMGDDDHSDGHIVKLQPNGLPFFNSTDNKDMVQLVPSYVRLDQVMIDLRTVEQIRLLNQVLVCFDQNAFVGCHFLVCAKPMAFPTRYQFTTFLRSSPLYTILHLGSSIEFFGPHLPRLDSLNSASMVDACAVLSLFHNVQKIEVDFWFNDDWSGKVNDDDDDDDVILTIDFLEVADWLHAEIIPAHTKQTTTRHAIVSATSLSYHEVVCEQLLDLLIKRFMEAGVTNRGPHRPFVLELTGCVKPDLAVCQQGPMRNFNGEMLIVTSYKREFNTYVIIVQRCASADQSFQ